MSVEVKAAGNSGRVLWDNEASVQMHSLAQVSSIHSHDHEKETEGAAFIIPLSARGLNENQHRRERPPSAKRQKTSSSVSRSLLDALYSDTAGASAPTAEETVQDDSTGTDTMASPASLSGRIHSILSGDSRGSYGPISLFSPPGSRRSSANDAAEDDVEAGAPAGLMSYVSSKRRQARHGRWIAFIVFVGGMAYFMINNMVVNDWLRTRIHGTSKHFDAAWVSATSKDHVGAGEWLGQGVRVIPEDASHVLVPTAGSAPVELLQPFKRIHAPSLVDFYTTGVMPSLPSRDIPYPTVDFIYTFVNASSSYLQSAMSLKRAQEGLPPSDRGASKHWRDNGEIRGSVRSSVQALGRIMNKVHLISADFDLDTSAMIISGIEDDVEPDQTKAWMKDWKAGQVPAWLDSEADQDRVQWHFHSEIFRLPQDDGVLDIRLQGSWASEGEWKDTATPSFSSFPIESRIGWVRDLNENFVYSNDDMFLTAPLELTDYHHPLLGPVIRVAGSSDLSISGKLTPDLKSTAGEWGGLEHAGELLKKRFTPRKRNYMMHMPKAMTKSMAHEASVMFAPELSVAATRSFRISKRGEADVHFAWLTSQLRIERWREALLWSWAVGRLGGQSGTWGASARQEVLDLFGIKGDGDENTMVWFKQQPRETIPDVENIMETQEWDFPLGSDYVFSSLDGHIPEPGVSYESPRSCGIIPSRCFPALFDPNALAQGIDAAEIFTSIAFDQHHCGDCLIIGLVSASGPRGLSAILPTEDQTYRPDEMREKQMWDRSEPMLPLVQTWREGNFSAANVVRAGQDVWEGSKLREHRLVGLREWCVKLLSRYIYSLADSPSMFVMTHNGPEMVKVLKDIDSREEVAMTCINDDQPDGADGSAGVHLGEWMERRFGEWEAGWEKEGWPWVPSKSG